MRYTILKAIVLGMSVTAMPALVGVPDGLLTSKTKLALLTTAGVSGATVHVDAIDGVVTLFGTVPTAEQKTLAEKTAREVGGVLQVKSLLQVVPETQEKRVERTDKDTKALAEKALKAEPSLKHSTISVKSVDKGVVLLTGYAPTFSDHLRAVVIIGRVPGTRQVASEVKAPDVGDEWFRKVTSASSRNPVAEARSTGTDMRISTAVKLRLLTTAHVPSTRIGVDTENRVVTLFGIVPSADVMKATALEATKVTGVARVVNQLQVVATSQMATVEAKDADIAKDLGLAFKDRPEFKGVETTVSNGNVRLTGHVESGWDEVNAVRMVRDVAGVRGVEDQLKVG